MWNHRDEEWFQKREADCITAGKEGQPRSSSSWKNSGIPKAKLDVPFEEWCADFLASAFP